MIESLDAPPPGSTAAGDLYVDLQTRTMWMGVDTAFDPAGAVLISDIMAIQPAIDSMGVIAKGYTDQQILTRAPKVHQHVAADVTDFDAAVHAAVAGGGTGGFFPGFIGMYSGPMSNIGTGIYAGWALCDGSNGTPDMRDRFVLGAGNRAPGVVNTLSLATTDVTPAHKHAIQSHVLTQAEMPVHAHAVSASGSGSGGTDAQGVHTHGITLNAGDGGIANTVGTGGLGSGAGNRPTDAAGNHAHNVSVSVNVSGATDNRGGGAGHNHEEDLAGAHSHIVSQSQLREALPYLTLAYIMKL
jgi:hypothetical protein